MIATSVTDVRAAGRELRRTLRRSDQAVLQVPARDPVDLLTAQHETRLPELVPVRIGRMLNSPFAYYRGTAAVMAHDLAAGPCTGVHVVSCGDAHISNFGLFASPERRLLFDLNDFDEAGMAPWEWDVKRLAASIHVGGRELGMSDEACETAVAGAVREYRVRLAQAFELSAIERHFFQVEVDEMLRTAQSGGARKMLSRTAERARRRTSERAVQKLTVRDELGRLCFVEQPPVMQHVEHGTADQLQALFEQYRSTLREDVAMLLDQFKLADYAIRAVGVGSVGTRCYVLLFEAAGGETLILQVKEATRSVLETHGGIVEPIPAITGEQRDHGRRVVAGQRILQAQSDPFLGWIIGYAGDRPDRPRSDFYWRQFRDMKGSIEVETLAPDVFASYVRLCAALLARAHSQSPQARMISAYLGSSDRFDIAIGRWARAYADICEQDFEALEAAVRSGRLPAERGV